MDDNCFEVVLKAKRKTSGTFEVGWQIGRKGYILNDKYSMLKGKTHTLKGCYDESLAKVPIPTLTHPVLESEVKKQSVAAKYCYIIIDGKLKKIFKW